MTHIMVSGHPKKSGASYIYTHVIIVSRRTKSHHNSVVCAIDHCFVVFLLFRESRCAGPDE